MKSQPKKINYKLNLSIVKNINERLRNDDIKLINLKIKLFRNPFKVDKKEASSFVLKNLNLAHNIASKRKDVE